MIIGLFCLLCSAGLIVLGHFTFNPLDDWLNYVNAIFLFVGAFFIGMMLSYLIYYLIALPINTKKERKKPWLWTDNYHR